MAGSGGRISRILCTKGAAAAGAEGPRCSAEAKDVCRDGLVCSSCSSKLEEASLEEASLDPDDAVCACAGCTSSVSTRRPPAAVGLTLSPLQAARRHASTTDSGAACIIATASWSDICASICSSACCLPMHCNTASRAPACCTEGFLLSCNEESEAVSVATRAAGIVERAQGAMCLR